MELNITTLLEKAGQAAAGVDRAVVRSTLFTQIAVGFLGINKQAAYSEALAEALKNADAIKYPHEKARALGSIAVVLARSDQAEEAGRQFNRAVLLARAAETPANTLAALYYLACRYIEVHYPDRALPLIEELYQLVADPKNEADTAAELVNLAELLDDLGERDQAVRYLTEAENRAGQLTDKWFKLERLTDIAESLATLGLNERAVSLLQNNLEKVADVDKYSRPYFLLRLAEICLSLRLTEQAVEILNDLPNLVSSEGTPAEKAGGLIDIAEIFIQLADFQRAAELLSGAFTITESVSNVKENIAIRIEIAQWLTAAGQFEKAADIAARVDKDNASLSDQRLAIFNWGNLAVLYSYLHNDTGALQAVERVLKITAESGTKTAGLSAVGSELAEESEITLALKLAEAIREPEARAALLIDIANHLAQ
jgi:tetratricopeptide (TPR) repeat protein